MRALQGSFGRLRVPLDINNSPARKRLLEICVRLNNVWVMRVGINQIQSVYMPIWRNSDDDELWNDLGNQIVGNIRRRDRVARFHLVVQAA